MCLELSVIVPTYNRCRRLEECLTALVEQEVGCDLEIIVVDDCSSDETPGVGGKFSARHGSVKYVRNAGNLGRCYTRNRGIKMARGRTIVMIDDDVIAERGCLKAHLAIQSDYRGERIAVMGNVTYCSDCIRGSNIARYVQSRYLGARRGNGIDRCDLRPTHFGTLNCSFQREDAIKVGLLDERFRYYGGEDVDFAFRLRRDGVRLVFSYDAKAEHYDTITVRRYKEKICQLARNGLKISANESPEILSASGYRFLVPYNSRIDSVLLGVAKFFVPFIVNRRLVRAAERFALWSDAKPHLYFKWLYYYLIAGWTVAGFFEAVSERETVRYGECEE